ncbi:MAG: glycosyltransferase [Candidatus Moraniibacteriota bacterium]
MAKKKILHVIQSLSNGGCENMLLRTLPLLDNFEHKVITLKELGDLIPKFVSAGITVETIHCNSPFDIPGILRLRKLIREEKPDIIITYLFHADILGRLALRTVTKAPIVPSLRTTYNHPKYLIARILEWITKPLVNQYLANSEAVKDFYVQHIGVHPEKITIIPNGIDIEHLDSITPDPELKKSLSIASDDFVIICVANLHINKGHRYLLEAFERLYSRNNETITTIPPFKYKLLLVGEGSEQNSLENKIKDYQSKENILFLGRRTDVPKLLKISNLFVLPTLFEGQSNAILEAMASGIPVITTDIPENKVLIENKKTGLLVPIENSLAIVQAIKQMQENEVMRKQLSEEAKIIVQDSFSLEKIAKIWENFLIETIK